MGRLARLAGLASRLSRCAVVLVVAGCAGEVEEGAAAGGSAPDDPPSSPIEVTLEPPVLKALDAFANVLRLTWDATPACEAIEGERRTAESPFEVVFTAPGTDSVFVDAEAIEDTTYTYRLRCKHEDFVSKYSNELSANPADG
jgi:hypothetical protein